MSESDAQGRTLSADEVRRQLAHVAESAPFRHADRQKAFLRYLVEEELAGRGEQISQYAIAGEVFARDETFDPAVDAVVRVEARRLRSKLAEYYASPEAAGRPVVSLPKGRYRVHFDPACDDAVDEAVERLGDWPGDLDGFPTIAVLPFDNMSPDPAEDYFSDGITEDIITDLSKVAGLSVISRHSTFVYKGRAVAARDISEDLGARYLVEGSVRRAGDRVRVTAQLIDAAADSHLWAERYDRTMDDVFALQDELARLIVEALDVRLTTVDRRRLGDRRTTDAEAHDLLLRAQEQFYRFHAEGVGSALAFLDRALALDPGFAEAQAWRCRVLTYSIIAGLSELGGATIEDAVASGREAIARAPDLAQGHAFLGWCLVWTGRSEEALQETRRALELDSSFADGHLWRAMALASAGQGGEAREVIERGMRLNPHYSVTYLQALGLAHFAMDQLEDAVLQCCRGIERNPDFLPNHLLLAASLALLDRTEEAAEPVAAATRLAPPSVSIVRTFFCDRRLDGLYRDGLAKAGYRPAEQD